MKTMFKKLWPVFLASWLWIFASPGTNAAQSPVSQNTASNHFVADSVRASDGPIHAAVVVWQKNIDAVKASDIKQTKKLWNKEEAENKAFFDKRLYSFLKYQSTIRDLNDTVVDASAMNENCIRLTIHWLKTKAAKPVFVESVYVIQENGKSVLAHALTAMTYTWPKQETRHFIYRYYPEHRFNEKNAAMMDSLTQNVASLFDVKLDHKIPFYIFPPKSDPLQFKKWNVSRSDLGEAEGRISLVVNWTGDSEYYPHEIVHVIQRYMTENVPCLFLLEGMATYFGSDDAARKTLLGNLKKSFSTASITPVDTLIHLSYKDGNLTKAEDQWVRYAGAAAVGYLNERFGTDKFKQFYMNASVPQKGRTNAQNFSASLKEIYHLTTAELDEKYRAWLMTRSQ